MNEILLRIQNTEEALSWVLLAAVMLNVFGLVVSVWTGMMVREVARLVDKARVEGDENSRKISYYLFRKLGPVELE